MWNKKVDNNDSSFANLKTNHTFEWKYNNHVLSLSLPAKFTLTLHFVWTYIVLSNPQQHNKASNFLNNLTLRFMGKTETNLSVYVEWQILFFLCCKMNQ